MFKPFYFMLQKVGDFEDVLKSQGTTCCCSVQWVKFMPYHSQKKTKYFFSTHILSRDEVIHKP